MKEFRAQATIFAPLETIWTILTDASAYPEFDASCERIEGRIEKGEKLTAYSKLSPGRGFGAKVVELERGERMVWSGGMPLGLFKGVRTFTTTKKPDGSVEVTLHEVFSGPMLALIGKSLPDMTEPFEGFVKGLKNRAEKRPEP